MVKKLLVGFLKMFLGLFFTLIVGGGFGVIVLLSLRNMGFALSFGLIIIVMAVSLCMGSSVVR